MVTAGFNSVHPGSLSLPLVPGVVCTSREGTQHCSTGWGALGCAPPLPRFTLVTGGAGGLQLHSPAWLSPLIRTMRKSSSLHLGSLPMFLLSLSLDDVQSAPWECGGATVAFHHVSDDAGDSWLLLGLSFFQSTIQPFPLCGRQAPSVNFPFPELQRERGAVPQSGPVYCQAPGTRVCSPSSPDVAQHGHTITSYTLLSYQA